MDFIIYTIRIIFMSKDMGRKGGRSFILINLQFAALAWGTTKEAFFLMRENNHKTDFTVSILLRSH